MQGKAGFFMAGDCPGEAICGVIGKNQNKGDTTMSCKEEFIDIFKTHITREGADKLLDYLTNKSDFFTAPASAPTPAVCASIP